MTNVQANATYDILVAECGACEIHRNDFLAHMLSGYHEYRCCHALGFSGKFYPKTMTVGYYKEDETPVRELIRETANKKLAELAKP